MKLPFKTHTIYITLDDENIYELQEDFSKVQVSNIRPATKEHPVMVINKNQFDRAKMYLFNPDNPFKIDKEAAIIYFQLGFINEKELKSYLDEIELMFDIQS